MCSRSSTASCSSPANVLSATQCGSDICPAGTEDCYCGDEGFCESGLYCDAEEDDTCRSEGGGEEGGDGDVS